MMGSTSYQLSMLFVVQTVVFTALFLVLYPRRRDVHLWSWSNAVTAASILIVGYPFENLPVWLASLSGALTLFGAVLKVQAYGAANLKKRAARIPKAGAVLTLLFGIYLIVEPDTPYKLFLLSVGGLFASGGSMYFVLTNRAWAGMPAKWVSVVTLLFSMLGMLTRLFSAYPFGPYTTFMKSNSEQALNLVMLVFFSFIIQISFLALIAERSARDQVFAQRRSARLQARAVALAEERQKFADVAAERMSLLRMLTHEVRQPLNNAQAALQTIMMDLSGGSRSPELVLDMAKRAQRTVSDVVLAISNSIVGATLISSSRQPALEQADLCTIAGLAILDVDPADRGRIDVHYEQEAIFAAVDPVLLRLALRNLVENALKFSPVGRHVNFAVGIDDDRMMAIFTVRNSVADPSLIIDDMFGFEKRGSDSRYGGMGLGLFIVKRCAELHRGTIDYVTADGAITFELALPC